MSRIDLMGIIKDYLNSINCPMMKVNEFNKFDYLDDLNGYLNNLNCHK